MKPHRTSFFLPFQMLNRLKAAHDKTGLSISELMRNAIEKYLRELEL